MNDLQMAAKFREAADYLRKHGWTQGTWGRNGGPACAEGALEMVCQVKHGFWSEITGIYAKGVQMGHRLKTVAAQRVGMGLWLWNDEVFNNGRPQRTSADVIALFEGLAFDLELRHQIANSVMATSNLVEQIHDSAIIPSLEAVPVA